MGGFQRVSLAAARRAAYHSATMAPKNQSETLKSEPAAAGAELVFEGLTIQEWAGRAKSFENKYELLGQDLDGQIQKLIGVEGDLARYKAVIGEATLDLGEFTLEITKRPIALADRDRLKQAETTIGALSQWLAQQRSAMAKLLVTEYPAIRIIGEKVMFGNGVFAPKGMVYSRELHPNQFAQIVAERLPDIDYVWESSVKS